jgi:hypothetical protein
MDFSKLKRRNTPPSETTVVLFGSATNDPGVRQSINKVAITGRKVKVTPRVKEYETTFPDEKVGFNF